MNNKKILNELKNLTKNEISLEELAKELKISPNLVMGFIFELKKSSVNLTIVKKDDGIYILNQGEKKYKNDYNYTFNTKNNEFKFLLISDTRLCSIFTQKTILNELYLQAKEKGISTVIHAGNITEGLYKMTSNMVNTLTEFDTMNQVKYVVNNYPYVKGIKTYFITGKKDQTHLIENQINIGNQISLKRPDLIYLGDGRCSIYVDNVKMLLLNNKQIKTYTQSYRPQKLIDAMRSEDKPNILLYGGLLQYENFPYRDVNVISIPSLCATTWEMEEKSFSNTVGGVFVNIKTDSKGNLLDIVTSSAIYYNTLVDDYKTTKTLRRVR